MAPGRRHRRGQGLRAARAGRRRLPHRGQVGLRAQGLAQAQVPGLQRRRVGAGDLQGPRADPRRPAPAPRGDHRSRPTPSAATSPTSTSAASSSTRPGSSSTPSTRPTRKASWARTSSRPATTSTSTSTAAPAPTSAARRPPCSSRSRASAASRGSSPPSRPWSALFGCPTVVNNVETLACVPHIIERGAAGSPASAPSAAPARSSSASPATSSGPASTSCPWAPPSARSSRPLRRRARRHAAQGGHPRRLVLPGAAGRQGRHRRPTSSRSPRPGPCSAPAA